MTMMPNGDNVLFRTSELMRLMSVLMRRNVLCGEQELRLRFLCESRKKSTLKKLGAFFWQVSGELICVKGKNQRLINGNNKINTRGRLEISRLDSFNLYPSTIGLDWISGSNNTNNETLPESQNVIHSKQKIAFSSIRQNP